MTINPSLPKGEKTWRVIFRHPLRDNRPVNKTLGTTDEQIARVICTSLEDICNNPELHIDPNSPRLLSYNSQAVKIFFGDASKLSSQEGRRPVFSPEDTGTLAERIFAALTRARRQKMDELQVLKELLSNYESQRYQDLYRKYEELETKYRGAMTDLELTKNRLIEHERRLNVHIRINVASAFQQFKKDYPKNHKRRTVADTQRTVEAFIHHLPKKDRTRLGEIRPTHVNDWLMSLKGVDGKEICALTRQKRKTNLSAFFTWAKERYELAQHAVQDSMTITGSAQKPENIEAMRLSEIEELINTLEPEPYWQAWVAFAILAGPRWGEQATLPLNTVNLEDNIIVVRSPKTGRQRRIPIEQTILRKIMEAHVSNRQKEQHKKAATDGEKSQWLFPTTVPDNPYKPRELTPVGQWSHSSVWHSAWERLVPKNDKGETQYTGIWRYGPREWRHTFGTALGHAPMTALEIADLMGNSPLVAAQFYVRKSEHGKRWPFRW